MNAFATTIDYNGIRCVAKVYTFQFFHIFGVLGMKNKNDKKQAIALKYLTRIQMSIGGKIPCTTAIYSVAE